MGPLLFNIDLCDLFLIMNHVDIANYADDNAPYVSGKNIDEVARFLEESLCVIFKQLSENHFQVNTSTCHMLLSTDQHLQVNIGPAQIEKSSSEQLLGVTIDVNISNRFMLKQGQVKSFSKNYYLHEHSEKKY